jgi:hypothetical protein
LTAAVAVLVQPFTLLVTVTVYVPEALTLGFGVLLPETIPGPDQLKFTPPVGEVADNTTDVVVQFSTPPSALAPGCAVFGITEAAAVLVRPLIESVTVTVYVPVQRTLGFGVVRTETKHVLSPPGAAQLKLTLGADDVADRTTDVVVQVSVPPVALAPGGIVVERDVLKTSPPISPANTTPAPSTASERLARSVSPLLMAIQFTPLSVETNMPPAVPAKI